jgi:hypothetical protein
MSSTESARLLGANHFMIARMAHQGQSTDEEFERRKSAQTNS